MQTNNNNFRIISDADLHRRLQRGLVLAAYIVTRHGLRYAPIFARVEQEAAAAGAASDTVSRAQELIDRYTVEGGVKAIR